MQLSCQVYLLTQSRIVHCKCFPGCMYPNISSRGTKKSQLPSYLSTRETGFSSRELRSWLFYFVPSIISTKFGRIKPKCLPEAREVSDILKENLDKSIFKHNLYQINYSIIL